MQNEAEAMEIDDKQDKAEATEECHKFKQGNKGERFYFAPIGDLDWYWEDIDKEIDETNDKFDKKPTLESESTLSSHLLSSVHQESAYAEQEVEFLHGIYKNMDGW